MPIVTAMQLQDEVRPRAASSPLTPNGSRAKLTGLPGSGLKKSLSHSPPPRPRVVPKLSFSETNLSVTHTCPQPKSPTERSASFHSLSPPPRPPKPTLPTLTIPSSPIPGGSSPLSSPVGSPHRNSQSVCSYHIPRPGGGFAASPSRSKSTGTLWTPTKSNELLGDVTPRVRPTTAESSSPATPLQPRPSLLLALPKQRTPAKTPMKHTRDDNTEIQIVINRPEGMSEEDEVEQEQRRRAFSEPAVPSWDFALMLLGDLELFCFI